MSPSPTRAQFSDLQYIARRTKVCHSLVMIIGPHLLSSSAAKKSTSIFLCGPGVDGVNFPIREFARRQLSSFPGVKVHFGEDIEKIAAFKRRRRDLQTLELEFAHSVDFTLLFLESPGSIAELGTFSMVENIRGRLIVLVPSQFYREQSYIARGPLSLLSRSFQSNVIYFDRKIDQNLSNRILYPLTFYKFANFVIGQDYNNHLNSAYKSKTYSRQSYEEFIGSTRRSFATAATYIGILILGSPTFPELISSTSLSPDQTSNALHSLFAAGKIEKDSAGRYRALAGYADPILSPFSTTKISEARSRFIADLDSRMAS